MAKDDGKSGKVKLSTNEIGVSGLDVNEGQILNNDTQKELIGCEGLKRIRNMAENDSVAWTSFWVYSYLMKSVEWPIVPASESAKDIENAEFIEEVLCDMTVSWKSVIGAATTMVRDGFAPFEIVPKMRNGRDYKDIKKSSEYDDGKWGLEKLALRGQMTILQGKWLNLEKGDWTGVEQLTPEGDTITIPREKMINFTTVDIEGNPQGVSLLRGMYRDSRDRMKLENTENIGHSRNTAGTLNIKVPPEIMGDNATEDQKKMYEAVKRMLKLYHKDEQGGFISPMIYDEDNNPIYDVEILSGGGGHGPDIDTPIKRKMTSAAMTMFTDWLFLGHDSGGNRALSGDRMELMIIVINSLLDNIVFTLNKELIPKLMMWNNMDGDEGYPKFSYTEIRKKDLETISNVMKNLSMTGMDFSDMDTENKWREDLDMPERTEVSEQDKEEDM